MWTFRRPGRTPAPLLAAVAPLLFLVFPLVGCSGAAEGGGADVGQTGSAILVPDVAANQTAFDFFVARGLTSFQAAGIVGNLDQESQMDPAAVQAGGPGRGIAQWSVGGRWDTDANDNTLWYAGTKGASATDLTLQLEFIWYELQTFSGYGLAALRKTTNVTDATIAFETDFEGCGTCDQANRIAYAEAALKAYGSFDYAAAYVSQSFPLASTALTMTAGETLHAYIELTNTGAKAWDASTHLGTTGPRDRASAFADSSWMATNRPVGVSGTVAPGASYKFTFDLHAPAKPGTYLEYFNLVEEGVAWFSDPGQGGPVDDDLEANIVVVAGPKPPPTDGGAKGGGGADGGAGGGASDDGSAGPPPPPVDDDGGSGAPGAVVPGATEPGDDGGAGASGATSNGPVAGMGAGCALAPAAAPRTSAWCLLSAAAIGLLGRRRSRRARATPFPLR